MASMYVRIKRKRTTVFLHVEPTDTVLSIKTKVQDLLQEPPARQRLYKDGAQLDDGRSLADLKVETDDVLALALRHEDGSWEEPEVADCSEAPEGD